MLDISTYLRKTFEVQAVQVTDGNIYDVAKWCSGGIMSEDGSPFIKVRVERVLNERQTRAFPGDWVVFAGRGYKVYTDRAFRASFDPKKYEEPASV